MVKSARNELEYRSVPAVQLKGIPRLATTWILSAVLAAGLGCAALSNPLTNGIPVRRVPLELLGESKEGMERLPLALLRQQQPPTHKLAAGDVLGIWIEGILGEKGQPPIALEPSGPSVIPLSSQSSRRNASAIGYPIPIRANGTITLPMVPPIKLDGLTLEQAEDEIRKAYTVTKKIIQPNRAVIVTLHRPREYHILVIRQDGSAGAAPNASAGGGTTGARSVGFLLSLGGGAHGARRGTGYALDLPVYENDVLNALSLSGGLPGTDAADEIIIERGSFQGEQGRESVVRSLLACPGGDPHSLASGTQKIRIPLRYRPGQPPSIRPEDVILQTGDIVFIESRESEVFYAAGLLPSGEYPLPRDTDLDVVQAILRIGGPVWFSGYNTANIAGNVMTPGLSLPRPTLVSVIRPTPCGKQVVIRVDLEVALREPRERILIQPKDLLLLQERPQEAFGRYLYEILYFPLQYTFANSTRFFGQIGYRAGYAASAPAYP